MPREIVKKTCSTEFLTLTRISLGSCEKLVFDKSKCNGCGICEKVCYKEAISFKSAVVREGKLLEKRAIVVNKDKCTFCGVCAALCPINAIKMFKNGNRKNTAVELEIIPYLHKEVKVKLENCDPCCQLVCKENCPLEAISVQTIEENGKILEITGVQVDTDKCIFCAICEDSCPQKAIRVTKPFQGTLKVDTARCPEMCNACVDVCPSRALTLGEDGKVWAIDKYCIYCGACKEVCPENAIEVKMTNILYDRIASGAWFSIMEKLVSKEYAYRELYASAVRSCLKHLQQDTERVNS